MNDTAHAAAPVMGGREWGLLFLLSVLWGGSFFFNAVALRDLPSFTLVWLRVAIAAAALLVVMRARREALPRDPGIWVAFFGMGLLNNTIPFALIVWGQHHIASGLASILNATTPIFTVLLAHWLTRDETLTGLKACGVAAGFAGTATMIGLGALGSSQDNLLAEFACLGAAMSYALAGIFGRRFRRMGVAPIATATGQVIASSLLLLPLMLLDRPWTLPAPHISSWAAVLGVALLSTALGYVLYFRILAKAGATNLLLVTFLLPVSAILLGAMVLGEHLLPRHFAGMALIGLGLLCIDGRVARRLIVKPADVVG